MDENSSWTSNEDNVTPFGAKSNTSNGVAVAEKDCAEESRTPSSDFVEPSGKKQKKVKIETPVSNKILSRSNMNLQKIQFAKADASDNEKKLYFKGSNYQIINRTIIIDKNSNVSGDTLFNSFSVNKWVKYTNYSNLQFTLKLKGNCKLIFFETHYENKQTFKTKVVSEFLLNSTTSEKFTVPVTGVNNKATSVYFSIIAKSDKLVIKDMAYATKINTGNLNSVKIALGICTYRREDFVFNNVKTINSALKNNAQLREHLEVFISDNANTLPVESIENKNIHIFYNKNLGGTGGFSRCMIEAFFNKKYYQQFSHIILMDDDISFNEEMLENVYCFLRLLKPEHDDSMIAFSMFPIETPYLQYTKGKLREKNISKCINSGLDARYLKNVIINEQNDIVPNFSGWWCHCIPKSYITGANLPFPFFIRCDDTEYGCRYKNEIITLNQFSIKHPSFIGKHPISMSYYDMRNNLIFMTENINALTKKILKRELFFAYKNSLFMDYDQALLAMQGVEDFINGPEFFKDLDMVELNSKLRLKNYKMESIPQKKEQELTFLPTKKAKNNSYEFLRLCQILPSWKRKYTTLDKRTVSFLYVKKLYCFDVENKQGYWLCKNRKKARECRNKYIELRNKIDDNFEEILLKWKEKFNEYTTFDYWIKILGLDVNNYSDIDNNLSREPYIETFINNKTENSITRLVSKVFPWYTKAGRKLRSIYNDIKNAPHFTVRSDLPMHIRILCRKLLNFIGLSFLNKNMLEMRKFKDRHKGERCFITCTGPSLTIDDLEKLRNEYTIGVNSITKAYEYTDWRPTYYALIDAYAYGKIIESSDIPGGVFAIKESFIHWRVNPKTNSGKIYKVLIHYGNHRKKYINKGKMKILKDPSICIYDCFTVTNMAINLAIYMGFKDIYIIGADATYKLEKTHFIEGEWETIHKKAQAGLAVAVQRSMMGYIRMKDFAEKQNVNIYNATRGGMLEIFARANLDEVLKSNHIKENNNASK